MWLNDNPFAVSVYKLSVYKYTISKKYSCVMTSNFIFPPTKTCSRWKVFLCLLSFFFRITKEKLRSFFAVLTLSMVVNVIYPISSSAAHGTV